MFDGWWVWHSFAEQNDGNDHQKRVHSKELSINGRKKTGNLRYKILCTRPNSFVKVQFFLLSTQDLPVPISISGLVTWHLRRTNLLIQYCIPMSCYSVLSFVSNLSKNNEPSRRTCASAYMGLERQFQEEIIEVFRKLIKKAPKYIPLGIRAIEQTLPFSNSRVARPHLRDGRWR